MRTFLVIVALLAYLFAAFAALVALQPSASDIQWILAWLCVTCGNTACIAIAVINGIAALRRTSDSEQISELTHGA